MRTIDSQVPTRSSGGATASGVAVGVAVVSVGVGVGVGVGVWLGSLVVGADVDGVAVVDGGAVDGAVGPAPEGATVPVGGGASAWLPRSFSWTTT